MLPGHHEEAGIGTLLRVRGPVTGSQGLPPGPTWVPPRAVSLIEMACSSGTWVLLEKGYRCMEREKKLAHARLLHGTLGQNKIRDVATICSHNSFRNHYENSSLRNKAQACSEEFFGGSLFLRQHKSWQPTRSGPHHIKYW